MSDKIAFSPDEAAHRAGVGRTLIFAEIRSGRLEAHKAGARTLITADALTAWIKSLPRRGAVPYSSGATAVTVGAITASDLAGSGQSPSTLAETTSSR